MKKLLCIVLLTCNGVFAKFGSSLQSIVRNIAVSRHTCAMTCATNRLAQVVERPYFDTIKTTKSSTVSTVKQALKFLEDPKLPYEKKVEIFNTPLFLDNNMKMKQYDHKMLLDFPLIVAGLVRTEVWSKIVKILSRK